MKKFLLTLIFLMCICVSFAQIQTNILGCRLGVSSYDEVNTTLREKGIIRPDILLTGWGAIITTYHIEFGGIVWNTVTFTVNKGVLMSVKFAGLGDHVKLGEALSKKYSHYKVVDNSFTKKFEDNNTRVEMLYDFTAYEPLILRYEHKTPANKWIDDL